MDADHPDPGHPEVPGTDETPPLLLSGSGDLSPTLQAVTAAGLEATVSEGTPSTVDALRRGAPCRAVLLVGSDESLLLGSLETLVREAPEVPVVLVVPRESCGPERDRALEAGAADRLVLSDEPDPWLPRAVERAVERHALLRELRQIRSRLDDVEARFRNTVHRGADGIVIVSRDDRTLRFVNRAAEEMFGLPAEELVGRPLGFPLVEGETSEIQLTRPGERPTVAELRVAETVWEGTPALLAYLREVTDRKRAERRARDLIREQTARREAEMAARRSRFLADASRALAEPREPEDVLQVLGELAARVGDLAVVETTENASQLGAHRVVAGREDLGLAAADLEGLSGLEVPFLFPALRHEVGRPGGVQLVRGISRSWVRETTPDRQTAAAVEALNPRALVAAPVAAGNHVLGVLYVLSVQGGRRPRSADVAIVEELAGRAGLALENARLLRLARHASRAKSDFLNIISHELRTPLTAIVGYSGLLQEGLAGPLAGTQLEYLEGIDRNSAALLRVIDQILLFADTEAERERVAYRLERLSDLAEDVTAVAGPLARREGLDFRLKLPPGEVEVPLDSPKVRQILLHLLGNAVKFTEEGGVELAMELDGEELLLKVRDSGIGIPAEDRERIFEAFTQGEPSPTRQFGGTGLGLNVVRNLVRLLGGRIELTSEVGRGSLFEVRLPLARPEPEEGSAVGSPGEPASPSS